MKGSLVWVPTSIQTQSIYYGLVLCTVVGTHDLSRVDEVAGEPHLVSV